MDINANNTSIMGKEIDNNINNTGESPSGRVVRVNKSRLGVTNKGGMSGTNIKVRVKLGGVNRDEVGKADIETDKKVDIGIIASTNNSVDSGIKVIN